MRLLVVERNPSNRPTSAHCTKPHCPSGHFFSHNYLMSPINIGTIFPCDFFDENWAMTNISLQISCDGRDWPLDCRADPSCMASPLLILPCRLVVLFLTHSSTRLAPLIKPCSSLHSRDQSTFSTTRAHWRRSRGMQVPHRVSPLALCFFGNVHMAITCKNAITIRVDPLWTAIVDIVVVGRGRKDGTVDDAWPGPANTHPSTSELPLATASAMINL